MKIKWEVEDGYVGKSGPHYLEIDDAELEGLSKEEVENYINDSVQEEFEQNVYPVWEIVKE